MNRLVLSTRHCCVFAIVVLVSIYYQPNERCDVLLYFDDYNRNW